MPEHAGRIEHIQRLRQPRDGFVPAIMESQILDHGVTPGLLE
jgi:hypothetical protein